MLNGLLLDNIRENYVDEDYEDDSNSSNKFIISAFYNKKEKKRINYYDNYDLKNVDILI
jgi:hypothetical protein